MTKVELQLQRYVVGDGDTPHILGSVSVDGGPSVSFVGWVALLALLEKSVEGTPPGEPPPRSNPPPAQR